MLLNGISQLAELLKLKKVSLEGRLQPNTFALRMLLTLRATALSCVGEKLLMMLFSLWKAKGCQFSHRVWNRENSIDAFTKVSNETILIDRVAGKWLCFLRLMEQVSSKWGASPLAVWNGMTSCSTSYEYGLEKSGNIMRLDFASWYNLLFPFPFNPMISADHSSTLMLMAGCSCAWQSCTHCSTATSCCTIHINIRHLRLQWNTSSILLLKWNLTLRLCLHTSSGFLHHSLSLSD